MIVKTGEYRETRKGLHNCTTREYRETREGKHDCKNN